MFERLEEDAALEALLSSGDRFCIFKHSTRCPVSLEAHSRVQRYMEASGQTVHLVDVIASRPLSLKIAERLEVKHESPQLLVVAGGAVVAHTSHLAIDAPFFEANL